MQVACRAVDNSTTFTHCALRITDDDAGTSTVYELLAKGIGQPQHAGVEADPVQIQRFAGKWVDVATPANQTNTRFSARTRQGADAASARENGLRYSPFGGVNSNHFVYEIVTGAGGQVPLKALIPGRTAPGLCGGHGMFQGFNCSY